MNQTKHKKQLPPTKPRGPRNPHDRRCCNNERLIRRAIEQAIAKRQINLRVQDICHDANITPPTFYLRYRNSNDALYSYENTLTAEFEQAINAQKYQKEVIFVILLHFVARNQRYFTATLTHHNCWLLAKIIKSIRNHLISTTISDKCFDIYSGQLVILIFCWGKYEHFNTSKIPLYTKKLMQTRIMNLGI